jgi:hypothetical protein
MAESANITSVDAIAAFRSQLIVYLSKARPLLEEISGEIVRMNQWLDDTQRRHWENEFRLRWRKLEESKAELFNARLSNLQEASSLHYMAVQRAERSVRECEDKLGKVRRWSRDLEPRTSPLVKQAEQFQTYLATEMPQAIAQLDNILRVLEGYTDAKKEPTP